MLHRQRYFPFTKVILSLFVITCLGIMVSPSRAEEVQWQGPSGTRIKEIRYFRKETPSEEYAAAATTESTYSNVIDSPPVNGFIPWIVLAPTDESLDAETTGIYDAIPSAYYVGNAPTGTNPRTDYFIGLFDTGASAHVIGYENAVNAGLYTSKYLTDDNYVTVTGVTGSVDAHVSQPYGLFMDGLDALEPNALGETEMVLASITGMVGEYNVSTLIGQNPGSYPDIATAIGTPMSVFYDTHIQVDQPVTVMHNGTVYTAPTISFYDTEDEEPGYANYIPLELKPLGSTNVQYITYGINFEDYLSDPFNFEFDYSPLSPTVIIGTGSQSLFFIHSVDLTEGSRKAEDRNRFMLDTGAQVTVIGDRVAARLGLKKSEKDFEVDVEGVNGQVVQVPGFYLDSLSIPAVGEWLEFTNVPVIWLEISSPEGGKLDGIIGMNLMNEYNLFLRAGGFMLEDDPRLEFERVSAGEPVAGDIAPQPVDGQVDLLDYSVFSAAWMTDQNDLNWNADADIAPVGAPDNIIDMQDLAVLGGNWLSGVGI